MRYQKKKRSKDRINTWTHTGEYCLHNAVRTLIIHTGTKIKHLEYQAASTYAQKWGAVALPLLRLLQALVLQASLVAQTVKNLPAVQETGVQSLGGEDPLEKRMATHSSIRAWRIPWTEESGGLQFIGSQSDTTEQLTLELYQRRG